MALLGSTLVTMLDVSKSKNMQIGRVAEVLVQENPMLNDIPYMEMNEGTIHKEEIRSALPAIYYRKANEAIPASKTTTEERTFSSAHFEGKSQIDTIVARRGGLDRVAYNRWNQAQGFIQALAIEHAGLTIYGSPVTGTRKTPGFFDIYSTLLSTEATSGQIIDAGGTAVNALMSMLLVHWGERSVFGIYPAGSQAGLKRIDRSAGGKEVPINALDSSGNAGTIWGYEEQFEIDHGLVVKDYRQCARIANIDPALLKSNVGAADLIDLMISARYKIHNQQNGTGVWYVNRTTEAFLHKQSLNKVAAGAGLRWDNYQGQPMLMFLGNPIRRADALLNTEAQVTTSSADI